MCLQERSWRHALEYVQLCVTEDDQQVVLRGRVLEDMIGKKVIQVRHAITGKLTSQWNAQCQHNAYWFHQLASWSSNNTPYLAHSCWDCGTVDVYDISRGQLITQWKQQGVKPHAICRGPGPDTLLLVDGEEKRILQLQLRGCSLQFIKQIPHNNALAHCGSVDICYSTLHDNIYLNNEYTVFCIPLSGGPAWQLGGKDVNVGGQKFNDCMPVCCDMTGRVYVRNLRTRILFVLDGKTGEVLHIQEGMPW